MIVCMRQIRWSVFYDKNYIHIIFVLYFPIELAFVRTLILFIRKNDKLSKCVYFDVISIPFINLTGIPIGFEFENEYKVF